MLCLPVKEKKTPKFGCIHNRCGIALPVKVWDPKELPSEQSQGSLEFKVSVNVAGFKKSVSTFSKILF